MIRPRFVPKVEILEDRCTPSVFLQTESFAYSLTGGACVTSSGPGRLGVQLSRLVGNQYQTIAELSVTQGDHIVSASVALDDSGNVYAFWEQAGTVFERQTTLDGTTLSPTRQLVSSGGLLPAATPYTGQGYLPCFGNVNLDPNFPNLNVVGAINTSSYTYGPYDPSTGTAPIVGISPQVMCSFIVKMPDGSNTIGAVTTEDHGAHWELHNYSLPARYVNLPVQSQSSAPCDQMYQGWGWAGYNVSGADFVSASGVIAAPTLPTSYSTSPQGTAPFGADPAMFYQFLYRYPYQYSTNTWVVQQSQPFVAESLDGGGWVARVAYYDTARHVIDTAFTTSADGGTWSPWVTDQVLNVLTDQTVQQQ